MDVMRNAVLAIALLASAPAFAQTEQDNQAHHPETAATPASPAGMQGPGVSGAGMMSGMMGPSAGGPGMMGASRMMGPDSGGPVMMGSGPMMGGDMMGNMRLMMGMMSMMGAGMRPGAEHIEGRLAFLKTELKITEGQTAEWNAFADTVRANAKAMAETHQQVMSQGAPKTLPDRLVLEQKAMTAHLDALKKSAAALDELYGSLDADQKKTADAIIIGPMGMPLGMM